MRPKCTAHINNRKHTYDITDKHTYMHYRAVLSMGTVPQPVN